MAAPAAATASWRISASQQQQQQQQDELLFTSTSNNNHHHSTAPLRPPGTGGTGGTGGTAAALPAGVLQALEELRAAAVRRGVRLGDAFRDFDRLRTGRVSRAQFLRALSAASGGLLPHAHASRIADAFAAPGGGSGAGSGAGGGAGASLRGTDEVLYREVVRFVHSVFTEENLERAPTRRLPPAEDKIAPNRTARTLPPELEAEYFRILQVRRCAAAQKRSAAHGGEGTGVGRQQRARGGATAARRG